MEEVIRQKLEGLDSDLAKRNYLREFLQALVLKILFEKKHFQKLIFTGGTALRFVYDLMRFSEDLDFSSYQADLNFPKIIEDLEYELKKYSFRVTLKNKLAGAVNNTFIKFGSLLFPLGLTGHSDEIFSIKLEVDTNPPAGGKVKQHLISKDFMFYVNAFDLPSLMAGKIHALCYRKFTKGRDYYDLLWYLGKKITPNFKMLNNAIAQTEGKPLADIESVWKKILLEKVQNTDFKKVLTDVTPFLERQEESSFFDKDHFLQILA